MAYESRDVWLCITPGCGEPMKTQRKYCKRCETAEGRKEVTDEREALQKQIAEKQLNN